MQQSVWVGAAKLPFIENQLLTPRNWEKIRFAAGVFSSLIIFSMKGILTIGIDDSHSA